MKNVKLLSAALIGAACLALVGCGKKNVVEGEAQPAVLPAQEAPSAPSVADIKPGQVIVAPISKIASAPGFDPNDASTIPPMPKSAMAKPADVASAAQAAASAPAPTK